MTAFAVTSPIDGAVIGQYHADTLASIANKRQQAQQAAEHWQALTVRQRLKRLAPIKSWLLENLDPLVDVLVTCTGKVPCEALLGEIYPCLDLLAYYQRHAAAQLAPRGVATSPFAFPDAAAHIERRPFGVVAVITPWNYPWQLTLTPVLTALIAGNAVMFKVSEHSVPVGDWLQKLFSQLALPDHLVQQVIGDAEAGMGLVDARPDLVFFTGGIAAGRAVMQRAAQYPVPVLLELGGKDPMLVFADADLERASAAALYGAFSNSGQICVSIERCLVEQSCYQDFVIRLCEGVAGLSVGHTPPGELGAITIAKQLAIIEAHYQDAVAKGASVSGPLLRRGNYVQPVVLWNVRPDMRILREESFGPLLAVLPFADENDAIASANATEYGLNASIWSRDLARAQRVAGRLQTGNWVINDVIKNIGHPGLPFGGVKNSGFGRYHGAEGLRSFTCAVSGLTSSGVHPQEPNWFPYGERRYAELKGYLDTVHGSGPWWQRIRRNQLALMAFRRYARFDGRQRWRNICLKLPWIKSE
ncbi:MAG: aldehyde dehydrogenase family protein [Methylococcales bacterium]|nr:aldehyde dehydrogenase family protein [Methylococcales bacterium]